MRKRVVLGSLILGLGILGGGVGGFGQGLPTPRGELRIVDTDPANWSWITLNVFEHLTEVDKTGNLVPRLATGWRWLDDRTVEFKLRQGVTFHNGEIFDAEIVKLNWDENTRVRQPYSGGTYVNFKSGSTLQIIDRHTVRFAFPEPDGAALVKLSLLHIGNRQFHRELGWGEKHW
jgi:ABC-type transport system substrate-binding protein